MRKLYSGALEETHCIYGRGTGKIKALSIGEGQEYIGWYVREAMIVAKATISKT